MKKTSSFKNAVEKIGNFLAFDKRNKISLSFLDGAHMSLKKTNNSDGQFLEIHTAGYDGTLPVYEAVGWVQWELYDLKANGFLK